MWLKFVETQMAGNCCPRPGGTACTPRPCRILTVVWPPHSCSLLAAMMNATFSTGWGCPPGVCRNSSVPVKFKLKSWQSRGIFGTVKCKQALHGSCHACLRVGGQMKAGGHHHPMCTKPVKSCTRAECMINKSVWGTSQNWSKWLTLLRLTVPKH